MAVVARIITVRMVVEEEEGVVEEEVEVEEEGPRDSGRGT
jgi:hypothetical protein